MGLVESLSTHFLEQVVPRLGAYGRPNGTFYSSSVVSEGLSYIRQARISGASLSPAGEKFVAGAAAYLALLLRDSYDRRGLSTVCDGVWNETERRLVVFVTRERDGRNEDYGHELWSDVTRELLTPRQAFPSIVGTFYLMTSLSLPTPEYLYLAGAYTMLSPFGRGNWPTGAGLGLDEDFAAARSLLIDDLHKDIGVPLNDRLLRQLSHWVVFPFYGWHMNDGQAYNIMTLVDQIGVKKILPFEDAVAYLRRMLTAQCLHLRNLAARTLLIFGEAPQTPLETTIFAQAMRASDARDALGPMAKYYYLLAGNDRQVDGDALTNALAAFQSIVRSGPSWPCYEDPIFSDPDYDQFGKTPPDTPEQRQAIAQELVSRYPENWFANVALASALLGQQEALEGVRRLTALVGREAEEPVAHLTLASHYVAREMFDRADPLYCDAVKRWPHDFRLCSNAIWSLTRDYVVDGAVPLNVS